MWRRENLLDRCEAFVSGKGQEKENRGGRWEGRVLTNFISEWQGKSNRTYLAGKRDTKVSKWIKSIQIHSV